MRRFNKTTPEAARKFLNNTFSHNKFQTPSTLRKPPHGIPQLSPTIYQTYLNIIEYISQDYQQVRKVLPVNWKILGVKRKLFFKG